jgi:transcriptional regulator with XRE-family HTH domain
MITGRQIRAARSLLEWKAEDLAREAGVTRVTISNLEADAVRPHEKTIANIIAVFDKNGVEFTDDCGVRMKPQGVEIFKDHKGFCRFYDILYADLLSNGGTIDACGVDETLFSKYHGEETHSHIERMTALANSRDDVSMRILIREGDDNYSAGGYARYRWLSEEYFSPACFYVFNNYLALISFIAIPTPQVILIKSKAFADAYRQQFQKLWETAIVPPDKKPKKAK